MPLVSAVNLKHTYGNTIILDGCSISVEEGERIGIVGRNGTGKTTLLKAIAGMITPDSGSINIQKGCRVGYLHQDPLLDREDTLRDAAERAFAELHRLHEEQHRLFDEMARVQAAGDHAASEKLLKQQARIETQIEGAGGYAIDHKIDSVLHGLGFTDAQFSIKVAGLSGGQRGRLALAKLLLEEPEVLLLDEPTNHLDIDGRLWLEDFLTNTFRGAVVMISHDRYLLDNVVNRIEEVEQGRLIDYPGNYADFVELRAERRLAMHRAYENQQHKFKKEEAFIRRYKAGQRAKQARGRETRLEREKSGSTLERPMELATFNLDLPKATRTGDIVLSARGLSKKYTQTDPREGPVGEKVLFQNLDVSISRGERWGIIGPNGAGKSTLVRCLLKDLEPDSGIVKLGSNLNVGYYRQTHEHVDGELEVYKYLQKVIMKEVPGTQFSEQQARNLAGAFLFSGDEQERRLSSLSGGERSRAVLAGLMASAKNVLVLDEPTNHLDISSAERLEESMSVEGGFEGTLILISHDRALIDSTCEHLLVLDGNGNVELFHGNYSEWHEKDVARRAERDREETEAKRRRDDQEKKRTAAAEEAKRREKAAASKGPTANSLARLKTDQLESKIEKIETRLREIDGALGDPDVWRDHAKANRLSEERKKLAEELEPLEFEWARRAESAE